MFRCWGALTMVALASQPPTQRRVVAFPTDCNGITVFDTHNGGRWGSVQAQSTSEGTTLMGPPGCTQQRGLPYNGFSPNVAIHGDQLLLHSGESSPFVLKGVNKWHCASNLAPLLDPLRFVGPESL